MMTTLREHTAIVLWIVVFAFIGLIVVEWGADYSSTSQTRTRENVGAINGRAISLQEFHEALRNAARMEQNQGRKAQDEQLVGEVWDAIVRDVLTGQEIERLGIQVSDEELAYYTRTQPPQAVQGFAAFQTDGKFDLAKYNQFLGDPQTYAEPANKAFVMQVENILRNQLLNYKLQRLITETVQVSPAEVRRFYAEHNEKVRVEYAFAPGNKVADTEVSASPAELEAYYQEHLDEFHHEDQVRLAYVVLPRTPSARDSLRVAEDIAQLRQELLGGADFAEMARSLSEDPASAANGGDLGVFGRGRMVKPFEEVAFALEPGQISQPLLTQFGWHLIKVEERLNEGGEEKVRARHLLLKFAPSRETEEELRSRLEALKAEAEQKGLEAAAQEAGLETRDSGYLGKGMAVPGLGQGSGWLVNLFMQGGEGAVSPVGGNEQFLWVAQLKERRAEGLATLDQVRPQVERAVLNQKKGEKAGQALQAIRQQVDSGGSLTQAAIALGLEARAAEPFSRTDQVPGIGKNNAFGRAAFRLDPGQLSEVVILPRGAYLLRLIEKIPADESRFQAESARLAEQLLRQRQTEALQLWFDQLYESAQIEDNRHLFGFTF